MATATHNWLKPVDSAYVKLLPPSEDITTRPFEYRDDLLRAPDGPALGVEIDEERFEKARRRYELELNKWHQIRGRDPRVPSRQFYYWYDYPEKYEWQATE